jgi:sucrose phosphorylase
MGGSLSNLEKVLNMYFPGMFQGGIHLLPPFPSSADRGFAPQTHTEIDPRFGGWSDISSLGQNGDIMLDLIVNHISSESTAFLDFMENGRQSVHSDMFLTIDKIWADGLIDDNDVSKVFSRRTVPFSEYTIKRTGCSEKKWTTFGKKTPSEQVDLDVNSSITKDYFKNIIETYRKHEVKLVRLDAAGYVIKKPGMNAFLKSPKYSVFWNGSEIWRLSKAWRLCLKFIRIVRYSSALQNAVTGYMTSFCPF